MPVFQYNSKVTSESHDILANYVASSVSWHKCYGTLRPRGNTKKPKSVKEKAALGRSVLDGDVLATVSGDTLNANFSTESLEEGVVLLATREDDGTFAVRRVVQNKSVINSALATFASVGAEQEKAKLLQEEQNAVDEQRAAARAALKAA